MRDTSGWWEPLQKSMIEASPKIAPMSPSSFYQAECGIWLSEFLGIEPKYLWAITSMAHWINVNWTKEQKRAMIIARYYLSDDRHSWRQFFDAYRRSDPDCRLYDINDANENITRIDPPSAYTLNRDSFYSNLLTHPPKYRKYDIRSAPKGHYIYNFSFR